MLENLSIKSSSWRRARTRLSMSRRGSAVCSGTPSAAAIALTTRAGTWQRGQIDEVYAVSRGIVDCFRHAQRQPRLANAAGAP